MVNLSYVEVRSGDDGVTVSVMSGHWPLAHVILRRIKFSSYVMSAALATRSYLLNTDEVAESAMIQGF